jgi:hypothetical protein
VQAPIRVLIHGEVPDAFAPTLRALDAQGLCSLAGTFASEDLERVLAGVDVAVLPSMWWDCAPLAAAECLAARVPLVVPRLGGLAEAVRDGVDGLVVDPLSVDALAAALQRVATEDGLLERLQAGIAPPHPFATYVDELEAIYAGERQAPAAPAAPTPLAVLAEGELPALDPALARVQRLGSGDPPLPHAADVELRTSWPPSTRAASSGRLVVVQPDGAAPAAALPPFDELWSGVPADAAERLAALAARPPRAADPGAAEPWPLAEQVALRVLATPAWRGVDRLAMLLAQWCAATTPATSACLYLLADLAVDGEPAALEQRVLAACEASGANLDAAADVTVLLEPGTAERDARLHAATQAYVPLHRACAGHERIARATGSAVLALDGHALADAVARLAAPAAAPVTAPA